MLKLFSHLWNAAKALGKLLLRSGQLPGPSLAPLSKSPIGSAAVPLIDFVRAREGRAKDNHNGTVSAYWDEAGKVWTIGYGTTGPGIVAGLTWTYDQCDAALKTRLDLARAQLLSLSPGVDWPPGAEDALTDFVYNEGAGRYAASTVRRCAQAGDWAGVKSHLLDWEFAGGKRLGGLVTRREGEAAMIDPPTVA